MTSPQQPPVRQRGSCLEIAVVAMTGSVICVILSLGLFMLYRYIAGPKGNIGLARYDVFFTYLLRVGLPAAIIGLILGIVVAVKLARKSPPK